MASMANDGTEFLPLSSKECRQHFPSMRRKGGQGRHTVTANTIYRWSTAGARGVVLRTWQVGCVRCTTAAAIEEFIAKLTRTRGLAADNVEPATAATSAARQRQIEATDEKASELLAAA